MPGAAGERNRIKWVIGYKFSVLRGISFEVLMYNMVAIVCQLKENAQCELQVKFYLGQNENSRPGGNLSALRNCSKETGGSSVYV